MKQMWLKMVLCLAGMACMVLYLRQGIRYLSFDIQFELKLVTMAGCLLCGGALLVGLLLALPVFTGQRGLLRVFALLSAVGSLLRGLEVLYPGRAMVHTVAMLLSAVGGALLLGGLGLFLARPKLCQALALVGGVLLLPNLVERFIYMVSYHAGFGTVSMAVWPDIGLLASALVIILAGASAGRWEAWMGGNPR